MTQWQRALIFQGGGSLGAYEAGVYRALYEWLPELDNKRGMKNRQLFDIVAGTSIGAVNASILVSYFLENRSWNGSADKLIEFWEYLSTESVFDSMPGFIKSWDYWHNINHDIASGESARRYYSTKDFIGRGVPHVFKPLTPIYDFKFFDPQNTWYVYDNENLKKSIEKFAKFPIATSFEKKEPRLLLVSIDVQEAVPVIFDSYPKKDGSRKSEYGRYPTMLHLGRAKQEYEHTIRYNDGIKSDFVMASASVPLDFKYTTLEVEDRQSSSTSHYGDAAPSKPAVENMLRYFWDGGLLTNTPLREAVIAHRNYWYTVKGLQDVPPLRICVVNLHPIRQEYVPMDRDGIIDRKNDMMYHDKTFQDERIGTLVTDYISLIRNLIYVAQNNGIPNNVIDRVLELECETRSPAGYALTYHNLLEGRFSIEKVVRIERNNDSHTISNKIFDFSSSTIKQLIRDGYNEAKEQISMMVKEGLVGEV